MDEDPNFRVLVVDDDELAVAAMSYVLSEAGCSVTRLATPIGVTQVVLAQDVDVVILDLQMPALRGDRLAAMLRGNRKLKHVPVVLVSAAPEEELAALCSRLDGVDFLSKRHVQRQLAPLVRELARRKREKVSSDEQMEDLARGDAVRQYKFRPTVAEEALKVVPAASLDREYGETLHERFMQSLPPRFVQITRLWRECSSAVAPGQSSQELLRLVHETKGECQLLEYHGFADVLAAIEDVVRAVPKGVRMPGAASVAVLAAINALTRFVRDRDGSSRADTTDLVQKLCAERRRIIDALPLSHTALANQGKRSTGGT
jgi:CheY-like chemotaxis protein